MGDCESTSSHVITTINAHFFSLGEPYIHVNLHVRVVRKFGLDVLFCVLFGRTTTLLTSQNR